MFDLRFDEHLLRQFAGLREETFPPGEIAGLPPTGLVVLDDHRPICLGFMIICDNGMGIFSDFLSDPRVEKSVRNAGVEFMREGFYRMARAKNVHYVTSFTKHEKLAARLQGLGFHKIDKERFFQMGRVLWP